MSHAKPKSQFDAWLGSFLHVRECNVWTAGAWGPPRYHPLGRTIPTGQRLPLSPARLALQKSSARQAQVGRKDIIFIKYPLATAKDLPKGL